LLQKAVTININIPSNQAALQLQDIQAMILRQEL